jgi:RNase adaptor protein for sRNA GlmZ degradation
MSIIIITSGISGSGTTSSLIDFRDNGVTDSFNGF